MIITTTNTLDGFNIEKYLGLVSANQVVGANLIADVFASFSDVFGGNSGAYRERLDGLFLQVISQLEEKATGLGANAIIGVRIDFDEISGKGKSMFMVTAIGTAVSYTSQRPTFNRYEIYNKLYELKQYLNENLITPEEYERESALVRDRYNNEVEITTQEIKKKEKKLLEEKEAEKEAENARRAEVVEALSKINEQLTVNPDGITNLTTLYGLKVDDVIEIKETGDCSSIDGFTSDGKIVCKVDGEIMLLNFNEIKLVS